MKFRNGAWLWADHITPTIARRLESHRIAGDVLHLEALDRIGRNGADRFEGAILQLAISSPMPDVIRVRVQHHVPPKSNVHQFDLDYAMKSDAVQIAERADELRFTSGRLSLRIARGDRWQFNFEAGGSPITTGPEESLAYFDVRRPSEAHRADAANFGASGNGEQRYLMQRLSLGVGETIYGMGERFGPLVKNGQSVQIWNEDGGTISEQAYKNIPFYLSSAGYGLLVNSPAKVEFEVGTERVSQMQFSVPGEVLDYYLIYGPDPKSVLEKYTRLAGRPALPPPWSFGLWLSTSFTTTYDEKTVNEFVDGMIARDLPLEVFHFDCFWMKQRHWCDFEWDRDAFPDAEGMLKRLKAKGLKICVWINPYISGLSKLFAEGDEKKYFIQSKTGGSFQRDQWQPAMALVDFTNPDAVKWYQSKLRALLKMGVDCFKTDFAERIPVDGVAYHDGSDPALMHNYYSYLYNKAVFDLLEDFHGKENALVFARSGTTGSQKMPVHWGGDCEATFESMAEDLRGGLSFCMSGAAFWSHDIGGFSGKADPALYKRWIAFGLLSTHSRLHGSESYRVPWLFDEQSVDVLRHFTKLKNRLIPYLFAAARDAHERGWPVMRAMVVEFPNDPACRYLDRQYMLGDSLLVAPIFNADSVADFYLPDGTWTDLQTGRRVRGGRWVRETFDYLHVPLFAQANSLIPMTANAQRPAWTMNDPLAVHLFEIAEGASIDINLAPTDGKKSAPLSCRREGNQISLTCGGGVANLKIIVRNRSVLKVVNGGGVEDNPLGAEIEWPDCGKPISFVLNAEPV